MRRREKREEEEQYWSSRVDAGVILVFLLTIAATIINMFFSNPFFNYYFQLIGVHVFLTIIVGLTKDGGLSMTSKLCSLSVFQVIGSMSLSLYLLHEPLRQYFTLLLHLCLGWPKGHYAGERKEESFDRWLLPPWTLIIFLPLCLLMAYAVHRFVEVPARNMLKKSAATPPTSSKLPIHTIFPTYSSCDECEEPPHANNT